MTHFNRKNISAISPLALLTLTACGGGGGGVTSVPSSNTTTSVSGNIVKGPLSNALVFLDYNANGIMDGAETSVRTDANGGFSISATGSNYTIVALTDETTIDTSSGSVLSGVTLKAPSTATVVTPTTTLMEEGDLTVEQVAAVLNLPEGVDPLTFNPFAAGVDADDALAVEKVSQQIMTAVNSFASAAEGAGADGSEAFTAALGSVIEVVKTKAEKLDDATATDAEKTLDFTNAADLDLIKAEVATKSAELAGIDTGAITALIDDTTTSIKNVNVQIGNVSDLTSDATKAAFSTMQALMEEVKEAATAEKASAGSGSISFKDPNVAETAAKNNAPTDITLSATEISETALSLVIGTLSTTDSDQPEGAAFTYSIVEVDATDYDAFTINQQTGELSLKEQPDYDEQTVYSVVIKSEDDGGKAFQKTFEIGVKDEAEVVDGATLNDFGDNVQSESVSSNDKTLIVVIDDFSERVHAYGNTTLYDYGTLELVTYYDNLYDIYTGAFSGYGNIDDYFVEVPDHEGGFYLTTPDEDSNSLVDLDLVETQTFTDNLGNLAYADTYLNFTKLGQDSEENAAHGDWVVEAICQTLENPSDTEILCIDVDFTNNGSFAELFASNTYELGGDVYTTTNLAKVISEFYYAHDAQFTQNESDASYGLSAISMSITTAYDPTLLAASFFDEISFYKIPFFQSAPNVNSNPFDWSAYIPNVISVGAWNVDSDGFILAANANAIPTIDLYANGIVEKQSWGDGKNFGTSFATPTAAASWTNYLNEFIAEQNASGVQISDLQLSTEEIAQIDYTNLVDSVVELITDPVSIDIEYFGSPYTNTSVNVLAETILNDGLEPGVFQSTGFGLPGYTVASVSQLEGFTVIAYDISNYDENLPASDTNKVKFLGNEELQLTLTGEANISYEYSGDGSVTFNGDLDAANVQFMGHVIPIFDPNVFMDVMIQRTTAPDGTYWDTMVVHADNADGDYVASFMWVLGGSALSVTSQAEFDTLVASVSNYTTENIPSNAVYGPGKDNWLTVLSDTEVTSNNHVEIGQGELTGAREIESNDEFANLVTSGSKITGQSSSNVDDDWFYLELTNAGTIHVDFENENSFYAHDVSIVDSIGNVLSQKTISTNGSLSAEVAEAGDYFVFVGDSYDDTEYDVIIDFV